MSLNSVISGFSTGLYTVSRSSPDTYVDGVRVPGAETTFVIDASIQPVTGWALRVLPEARHTEDVRNFWTSTPMQLLPNPDKIMIDGDWFEIFKVHRHEVLSKTRPFFRVYCARQTKP